MQISKKEYERLKESEQQSQADIASLYGIISDARKSRNQAQDKLNEVFTSYRVSTEQAELFRMLFEQAVDVIDNLARLLSPEESDVNCARASMGVF